MVGIGCVPLSVLLKSGRELVYFIASPIIPHDGTRPAERPEPMIVFGAMTANLWPTLDLPAGWIYTQVLDPGPGPWMPHFPTLPDPDAEDVKEV